MEAIKIVNFYSGISVLNYEGEQGGSYAYLKLLVLLREARLLLSADKEFVRESEQLEAVSWMINEYLGSRFTPRHFSVFQEQKFSAMGVLASIQEKLKHADLTSRLHAQAA